MSVKKRILGKILANSLGYNVRAVFVDKTSSKNLKGKSKGSFKGDSGKFGVYAGKNLRKGDFNSKAEALEYCIELYNKT